MPRGRRAGSRAEIHGQAAQEERAVPPPTITAVHAVTGPLRLKVSGSNFHASCTVRVNGTAVPFTKFKSSTLVVAKGSGLASLVPKGVQVQITVVNNDDGGVSAPFPFTR